MSNDTTSSLNLCPKCHNLFNITTNVKLTIAKSASNDNLLLVNKINENNFEDIDIKNILSIEYEVLNYLSDFVKLAKNVKLSFCNNSINFIINNISKRILHLYKQDDTELTIDYSNIRNVIIENNKNKVSDPSNIIKHLITSIKSYKFIRTDIESAIAKINNDHKIIKYINKIKDIEMLIYNISNPPKLSGKNIKAKFICDCGYSINISPGTLISSELLKAEEEKIDTEQLKSFVDDPTLPRTKFYICKKKTCPTHKNIELKESIYVRSNNSYTTFQICCECKEVWLVSNISK